MSREMEVSATEYTDGGNLYAVAYLVPDSRYVKGSTLETYNASHWSQYAITLTLNATDAMYYGDFPAVQGGDYLVRIYVRAGGSPATSDVVWAEQVMPYAGTSTAVGSAADFNAQLALDAIGMMGDFGETITYKPHGGTPVTRVAIVDRNPPAVISEDGHTLADSITITIPNDGTTGITGVNVKGDKITVSGRFGGAATDHTVRRVDKSDAGMWTLRVS